MSPDIHPGITFELHTGATVTPDAETGLWCEHWGCPRPGRHMLDGAIACGYHQRDHEPDPPDADPPAASPRRGQIPRR